MVRIVITTNINAQNTQQQYAMIALLTCLEALLGVINACLPVMKPVFTKLCTTNIFSSFRIRTTTRDTSIGGDVPRAKRKDHTASRGNYPRISPPRQIVHKESLLMFSPDPPIDVRAPSIPLPNFSWRPLSRFYLPRAEWEHDTSETKKNNGTGGTTEWDFGYRRSEGNSPTLPWHPQWRNNQKDAVQGLK